MSTFCAWVASQISTKPKFRGVASELRKEGPVARRDLSVLQIPVRPFAFDESVTDIGRRSKQVSCTFVREWYDASMDIRIIRQSIQLAVVDELARATHITLVKGVADVAKKIIALGGEWHIDANNVLIADGSEQKDLWGFNVYPKETGDTAIEYISLINIRPAQGNRSMELTDPALRTAIREIVKNLIPELEV